MKKLGVLVILILLCAQVQSQESVTFINALGEKDTATFGNAVTIFMYVINQTPKNFSQDNAALTARGISAGMEYGADRPLRRGMIAKMVARHMDLRGSLMYNIFGTERYAYTACVDGGVMDPYGSEWDVLSGEELIEVISRMTESTEGDQ
jgi:hypothetical protein